jgi:hypothetical protein
MMASTMFVVFAVITSRRENVMSKKKERKGV